MIIPQFWFSGSAALLWINFLSIGLSVNGQIQSVTPAHVEPKKQAASTTTGYISNFQFPTTLSIELFAANPLVVNPVAFTIDDRGRVFVAETFRFMADVKQTKDATTWSDHDLASRSLEDRFQMYHSLLGKDGLASYQQQQERIRCLIDSNRDGKADLATVFADNFRHPLTGIGSGLLVQGETVWYTCLPDLWQLHDKDGDQIADTQKVLHTGFGVHHGTIGHDLHGLTLGPDGKVYFSMGDRGFHIELANQVLSNPDSGAVLRCNPDGSDLEIFATGLRNPQELVFDNWGNLFTVDNNANNGDRSRLVHLLEGGDSGWRFHYASHGAIWINEALWKPHHSGQPGHIVPPIANFSDGPSGFAYYPGTGFSNRYHNYFFLCDFRAEASKSGIHAFSLSPLGASFQLKNRHRFIWSVLATDVAFGPDSSLYFTDWIQGWEPSGKGRIYRAFSKSDYQSPSTLSVYSILTKGLSDCSPNELIELLNHYDQRVRLRAQWALTQKGPAVSEALAHAAHTAKTQLGRIHAIWALGILGRHSSKTLNQLPALLNDPDVEIRIQVCRVLGDNQIISAIDSIIPLLDGPPRLQLFAAEALGKLQAHSSQETLLQTLDSNNGQDPFLRHAIVKALAQFGSIPLSHSQRIQSSVAVRHGVLLAQRQMQSDDIRAFLHDPEPSIVFEAIRAIYDVPLENCFKDLVGLRYSRDIPLPVFRRLLFAMRREADTEAAGKLADTALNQELTDERRELALSILIDWEQPLKRDPIHGHWWPSQGGNSLLISNVIDSLIHPLLMESNPAFQRFAVELIHQYQLSGYRTHLTELATHANSPSSLRAASLNALDRLDVPFATQLLHSLLQDNDRTVRLRTMKLLAKRNPTSFLSTFQNLLLHGSIPARQDVLLVLSTIETSEVTSVLKDFLRKLIDGNVPESLILDILQSSTARKREELQPLLLQYQNTLPADDTLASFLSCLHGGSVEKGRNLFFHNGKIACSRCHRHTGIGGQIGPDLSTIGERQSRRQLLEALLEPNRQIAEGFESVVITTDQGKILTGILQKEDSNNIDLRTLDGEMIRVPKSLIDSMDHTDSAMPGNLTGQINVQQIRDLIAFLKASMSPVPSNTR